MGECFLDYGIHSIICIDDCGGTQVGGVFLNNDMHFDE